ncbi:phosphoribosylformylglycinamidine synthase [Algoriphagus aestuariicola]|uniref:Phosphoribosylformylglycinamidine synthase n=1 Tax=Algoriphagus aestuariicola TaxID=1852016 RepID=A0ABS3BP20_9BACT|nr:HAEPLYID family protein [Algoriphagus aestuariicola]MBN7801048.1 phosphoribosylformylglycinamidine synthase [Algoriphagus aestuariicola]
METIKKYFSALVLSALALAGSVDGFAQNPAKLPKVHHAEPLYMDLVRDLGARKGEKEFNLGTELKDRFGFNQYTFLAEYEFAPINRLGLEVEADFNIYKATHWSGSELPGNKLEGLRFSSQYSFLVSVKYKATLALGYTQILELTDFNDYGETNLISGTVFNPFFVAAKRWGENFHTVVYTYPMIERSFGENTTEVAWGINTSLLYSIPTTSHFVGVELNKEIDQGHFAMTIRPQAKIRVNERLAVGMVTGFPVHKSGERFSSFFRLIYEP